MDAAEAGGAGAGVAVDAVGAVGTVLAGVAGALVDVLLALGAAEAGQALAEEGAHAVRAGATVVAWIWMAEDMHVTTQQVQPWCYPCTRRGMGRRPAQP